MERCSLAWWGRPGVGVSGNRAESRSLLRCSVFRIPVPVKGNLLFRMSQVNFAAVGRDGAVVSRVEAGRGRPARSSPRCAG
jgi:hypothetical protein